MSTHTANLSAYTRSKPSVIPIIKSSATSGDISSVKHSAIPDIKYSDNPTTTSNIGSSVNPSAKPNVNLVLATVDLTVNLNCKLYCSHIPV